MNLREANALRPGDTLRHTRYGTAVVLSIGGLGLLVRLGNPRGLAIKRHDTGSDAPELLLTGRDLARIELVARRDHACAYCGEPAVSGYPDQPRTLACRDCGLIPRITSISDSLQEIRSELSPERLIRALRHEEEHEGRLGITGAIATRLRVLRAGQARLRDIAEGRAS